jgi:UDPglucose 6-dehydrogenase
VRTGNPILFMDIASAEVTKYAANAMLATRISFMNQIAAFCELVGADVHAVRKGIGTDRRIGPAFLFPGPGYGGSCFPKDVKALVTSARELGLPFELLESVESVNVRQKQLLLDKTCRGLGGDLKGKTVAVWGLAFKAETDDMRESPAIPLIEGLLKGGARVRAHDPKATDRPASLRRSGSITPRAVRRRGRADALVIVTEWLVYRNPDFERLKASLRRPLMIDGRNLFDPERMKARGLRIPRYRPQAAMRILITGAAGFSRFPPLRPLSCRWS